MAHRQRAKSKGEALSDRLRQHSAYLERSFHQNPD
jgi:hypothetical protein